MKKRLFFNKYDKMIYISHLDLLRFLTRILRKSDIPVKYSQGFHPRPKVSLGNPISLGTAAYNEPVDVDLLVDMNNEELLEKLNENTVKGFEFTKAIDIDGKTSIVEEYRNMTFIIQGDSSSIKELDEFLQQDEILLTKEKRGKVTTKNLKTRIKEYRLDESNEKITLVLENMSPNSFLNLCGIDLSDVKITKYGL